MLDANFMFDLHSGGVLGLVFRLQHVHYTTDLVASELKSLQVERWEQIGLNVRDLSGEQVKELSALHSRYGKACSVADLSTVVLAKAYDSSLVTRDRALARTAVGQGIEVIHSLDVIEELVASGVLTPADAASALRLMMERRRGFPQVRTLALIHRWRGT